MSEDSTGRDSPDLSGEIEVTPKMVEARVNRLFLFHIIEPDEDELRIAVTEVFEMMRARSARVLEAPKLSESDS